MKLSALSKVVAERRSLTRKVFFGFLAKTLAVWFLFFHSWCRFITDPSLVFQLWFWKWPLCTSALGKTLWDFFKSFIFSEYLTGGLQSTYVLIYFVGFLFFFVSRYCLESSGQFVHQSAKWTWKRHYGHTSCCKKQFKLKMQNRAVQAKGKNQRSEWQKDRMEEKGHQVVRWARDWRLKALCSVTSSNPWWSSGTLLQSADSFSWPGYPVQTPVLPQGVSCTLARCASLHVSDFKERD